MAVVRVVDVGGRFRAVEQALAYEPANVGISIQETYLEDLPEPSRLSRRAAHGLAEQHIEEPTNL